MIIANMATFPSRQSSTLQRALTSIAVQVDFVNLCLNEFSEIPAWLSDFPNVNAFIPDNDYKDVGKFVVLPASEDEVFYVDDDIVYPQDYVKYSMSVAQTYESLSPIVGLHGVIYADVFDGNPQSRNVFSFRTRLATHRIVNQLGTGTVHCKGWQCPTLDYMRGSEKFVDVRFGLHAMANQWPMICMAREANWLLDLEAGDSIFEGFTKTWPLAVTREVQSIAGYGRLPLQAVASVEC